MSSPDDLLVEASTPDPTPTFAFPGDVPIGDGPIISDDPAPEASAPPPAAPTPPEGSEPKEFDERWREPFQGLIYIGHLEDEFTLYGHRFKIMTPSQIERMQIGPIHAPFSGTLTSEMSFESVFVAAYLVSVDDQQLPQPVMNGGPKDAALRDRFNWVVEYLKRPVISQIYEKCLILENDVDEVLARMGEAQG